MQLAMLLYKLCSMLWSKLAGFSCQYEMAVCMYYMYLHVCLSHSFIVLSQTIDAEDKMLGGTLLWIHLHVHVCSIPSLVHVHGSSSNGRYAG